MKRHTSDTRERKSGCVNRENNILFACRKGMKGEVVDWNKDFGMHEAIPFFYDLLNL
jgi:hypothetical protein